MKQVNEMPKKGQFVAVWIVEDCYIFSDTLLWIDSRLFSYQEGIADYSYKPEHVDFYEKNNAKYFIAD